jgi:K+-sensing histidine kinase KdpD
MRRRNAACTSPRSSRRHGSSATDQVGALFEPFRRQSGDRLDHGGVGLGLTIARSIVAAHRGHVGAVGGLAVA